MRLNLMVVVAMGMDVALLVMFLILWRRGLGGSVLATAILGLAALFGLGAIVGAFKEDSDRTRVHERIEASPVEVESFGILGETVTVTWNGCTATFKFDASMPGGWPLIAGTGTVVDTPDTKCERGVNKQSSLDHAFIDDASGRVG